MSRQSSKLSVLRPEAEAALASIELDRDLRVAQFTPSATAFFELLDSGIGRSLSYLPPRFVGADLHADAREVLRAPRVIERKLWSSDRQAWFTAHVMPRVPPGAVAGVAITIDEVLADADARRLATVVRDSNDAITMQALDGRILAWNRGAERMYGYTEAEALRLNIDVLVPEEERERARSFLEAIGRGEEIASLDVKRLTKDGRLIDVWLTTTKLVDDEGRVVAVATTERDITSRRQAAAEARRLATVLRDSNDAVMLRDLQGRILTWNRGAERMYGYTADEAIGMHVDQLTDERGRELARSRAEAIARGEEVPSVETKRRTKDGRLLDVWLTTTKVTDDQGRPVGVANTERDVTERNRMLASLVEKDRLNTALVEQMREADQNRARFLAVLSHELRNPLAPIRSCLYLLDRVPAGGEQARRALATIDRQVAHLTRLVGDLLDVTRITRGKIELQRERLELCGLVRRAVEDHRAIFAAGGVTLELALEEPEGLWVSGDATRLAQAVGNLLHNAAKFTPRGGTVSVSVSRTAGGRAEIRVRDDGRGIPRDMLPRLFQPFTQADTSLERSQGGLGLGLALVKGLVELHGGSVRGESDGPHRGAAFTITLPLVAAPGAAASARREAPGERAARRVLVIEDNVDAAESLREVLELSDHVVEVAYSGPEGIEKARAFKPEVVLCDIGLPGMDGYSVARAMSADPAFGRTSLVALSGYAQPEDVARAKAAGFHTHLAKPPHLDALEDVLARGAGAGCP